MARWLKRQGADAEAGGAHAARPDPGAARSPMPTRPDPQAPGLVLPPVVWAIAGTLVLAALVIMAIFTF